MQEYKCWFPQIEDEKNAGTYEAYEGEFAAEEAAQDYARDTGYMEDVVIAVRDKSGNVDYFNVEIECYVKGVSHYIEYGPYVKCNDCNKILGLRYKPSDVCSYCSWRRLVEKKKQNG